ncbi:unnamed protein product [Didymodactylos carnosus]|uniref:EF-hand domain-containing protein n=1 Tax=Didymodactylos carnosus TaxID=1234261 RepID=A0A815KJ44_9BILA|nr:unnamed protein product [Didymodactylos carnosus]CAF4290538.1 unnamed protein product [Didymodactylos carnosus]
MYTKFCLEYRGRIQVNDIEITENYYKEKNMIENVKLTWNNFLKVLRTILLSDPNENEIDEAFYIMKNSSGKIDTKQVIQCLLFIRPSLVKKQQELETVEEIEREEENVNPLTSNEFDSIIKKSTFRSILCSHHGSIQTFYNDLKDIRGNSWLNTDENLKTIKGFKLFCIENKKGLL